MLCAGIQCFQIYRLWFDVGVKRYTTLAVSEVKVGKLWFDVGVKRYTTHLTIGDWLVKLWFDVGVKRYTTGIQWKNKSASCGLM